MTDKFNTEYYRHINSRAWRIMKQTLIRVRGRKCERCKEEKPLQLHHKTYERLGVEQPSDLELLCDECHAITHKEMAAALREKIAQRRSERQKQREANRYAAAFDTYTTKKYGDNWIDTCTDREYEAAEEEFDNWLERKTWSGY